MCLLKKNSKSNIRGYQDCIEENVKILHLGDLHATSQYFDNKVWQALLDHLKRECDNNNPFDLAVLPGDIVNLAAEKNGKPDQKFDEALKLVDSLSEAITLSQDKIAMVPGWHDVLSTEPYFRAFLQATNEFYNMMPPIDEDVKNSALVYRRLILRRLWGNFPVIVLCLNSCDPLDGSEIPNIVSKTKLQQSGVISQNQVDSVILTTGPEEIANSFIILVFHHTPWPETQANVPSQADLGARIFDSVSKLHPALCLTGHWHYGARAQRHNNTIYCSAGHICDGNDPTSNQFNVVEVGIFAHQKDVFGVRQRVVQWMSNKWAEAPEIHYCFIESVSKKIENYFKGQK